MTVRRSLLSCLLVVAACVEQPVIPRAGVPTLDDPTAGSYVAVSAGLEHTCALTTSGTAHCWGGNEFGQLGVAEDTTCLRDDRNIPCLRRPGAVTGGLTFLRISAGGRHTCGIATSGRIYCWGDNLQGELGEPSLRSSPVPIPILSTASFIDVATGAEHSCGLRTDGFTFCWGANQSAQLGLGAIGSGSAVPDSVRTGARFASLAAGGARTCARTDDGAAFCWGARWITTLNGDELTRPQMNPQRVLPAPPFKSLTVGTHSICGVALQGPGFEDNQAYCWEANPAGGLGDGTAAGSLNPRLVLGGIRFVSISTGELQTCGTADTGFAYCWGGDSFGQLGISSAFLNNRCGPTRVPCSTQPVRVSGWRVFSAITAGQGHHVCGLTLAGSIYCWGAGGMGQRGDGRTSPAEWSPVRVASMAPL